MLGATSRSPVSDISTDISTENHIAILAIPA
jgi:hypothetical protein